MVLAGCGTTGGGTPDGGAPSGGAPSNTSTPTTVDTSGSGGATAADTSTEAAQVFGLNETVHLKSIDVTALAVETSAGDYVYTPDAGMQWVGVKFTITVTGELPNGFVDGYTLFDFFVDGQQDEVQTQNIFNGRDTTADTVSSLMDMGTPSVGTVVTGWAVVQAPVGAKAIQCDVDHSAAGGYGYLNNPDDNISIQLAIPS